MPSKSLQAAKPRKALFIGLMLAALLSVAFILYGAWYIATPGLEQIHKVLPLIVGGIFFTGVAVALLSFINMLLAAYSLPYISSLKYIIYKLINVLFPLTVMLGRLLNISKRQLEGSFIAVSNLIFNNSGIRVPADRVLVITPHCLQLATCPHKITRNPDNCKRCGGCDIGSLVTLSKEMGFHFFVATGGTLARQIVYKTRPKAVLAIACERDLMSGIQDVYPLPAVGVLNIRPNGPCYNTHVDMAEVKKQLEKIIIPREKVNE